MKVKASNVARILADLDLTLDDVVRMEIQPGKVSVTVVEDGDGYVREYGVDQDA
jgi:coenzyme F420-reducing hydrogenase beta subunit